jgi:hypothetical protein
VRIKRSRQVRLIIVLIAASFWLVWPSHTGPGTVAQDRQLTAQLSAQPESVKCGGSSTLRWSTSGASSVEITGLGAVAPSGEQEVSPRQTRTYELIASDHGASARSTATVTVDNSITIALSISPTEVRKEQSATLEWSVTGADTVRIDALGAVPLSGERTVKPEPKASAVGPIDETHTYTLYASNVCGGSAREPVSAHIVGAIESGLPSFRIPPYTWRTPLPRQLVIRRPADTFGETLERVVDALRNNGKFHNYSVYVLASHGYAVVATPEHITDDGQPLADGNRWVLGDIPITGWTFRQIIERITQVGSGRYRDIVLVVSDADPTPQGEEVSDDVLSAWASNGVQDLPPSLVSLHVQPQTRLWALIYEFYSEAEGYPAVFVEPGHDPIEPLTHLADAGIWTKEELQAP